MMIPLETMEAIERENADLRAALAAERSAHEETNRERDTLKAECASISAEFGLPPTIRPAEGEITRMRNGWREERAKREEAEAALQYQRDAIDAYAASENRARAWAKAWKSLAKQTGETRDGVRRFKLGTIEMLMEAGKTCTGCAIAAEKIRSTLGYVRTGREFRLEKERDAAIERAKRAEYDTLVKAGEVDVLTVRLDAAEARALSARAEALEEAARVAERFSFSVSLASSRRVCVDIADCVRALTTPKPVSVQTGSTYAQVQTKPNTPVKGEKEET